MLSRIQVLAQGWFVAAALLLAPGGSHAAGTPNYTGTDHLAQLLATSYSDPARWLCHPRLASANNVCHSSLDYMHVEASGESLGYVFLGPAQTGQPVDCFYVYPTASVDAGPNSDFVTDLQEEQVTAAQFAHYVNVCRPFAPVYRQRTLTVLAAGVVAGNALPPSVLADAEALAYSDVRAAFDSYLSRDNNGRGFILVGHSQGATILKRLIAEEVEPKPALHARLIAAHLMGTSVDVPVGADVGGSFARTPACRHPDQYGCVVSYASYRAGDPERSAPRYGITTTPGMRPLCNNPEALVGGAAFLQPMLAFQLAPAYQVLLKQHGSGGPYADSQKNLWTYLYRYPYYRVPEQIEAECVSDGPGRAYLEIRIHADPADPRADDYPGEFWGGTGWGMHLQDINLARESLIILANRQLTAWLFRR